MFQLNIVLFPPSERIYPGVKVDFPRIRRIRIDHKPRHTCWFAVCRCLWCLGSTNLRRLYSDAGLSLDPGLGRNPPEVQERTPRRNLQPALNAENDPGHNDRLLADVLNEGVAADFREGLLNETLRLARRRRGFRQVRRAASALAVLVGVGLLVWHQFPSGRGPAVLPHRGHTQSSALSPSRRRFGWRPDSFPSRTSSHPQGPATLSSPPGPLCQFVRLTMMNSSRWCPGRRHWSGTDRIQPNWCSSALRTGTSF